MLSRRQLLQLAGAAALQGQSATGDRTLALERAITAEMARQSIPGLTAAIVRNAQTEWAGAYGLADIENDVPMRMGAAFRIASIAKPMTAVAVLQLFERGKLDLEAPLEKYVPEFGGKKWKPTVRQVLCHLGGVRTYRGSEFESKQHFRTVREGLGMFAADPLVHEPGTKYLYSSFGFNLLGAAVETVSNEPYEQYMRTHVWAPAGMTETQADHVYRLIPHRAHGYRRRPGRELENCSLMDTSNKLPGGGLVSTAADLGRFAQALMTHQLLRPETLEIAWTPQRTKDGVVLGYGLGFSLSAFQGRRTVGHDGNQAGFTTMLVMVPEGRTTVVLLMNKEEAQRDLFRETLLSVAIP